MLYVSIIRRRMSITFISASDLSASEIAGLKLDADWVILSACNTAGGSATGEAGAEALSGLAATFERYWQEATARRDGKREWKDYTPYELRSVGALLRLGQPERAWAMLDFFFKDQRPEGWNQWAATSRSMCNICISWATCRTPG